MHAGYCQILYIKMVLKHEKDLVFNNKNYEFGSGVQNKFLKSKYLAYSLRKYDDRAMQMYKRQNYFCSFYVVMYGQTVVIDINKCLVMTNSGIIHTCYITYTKRYAGFDGLDVPSSIYLTLTTKSIVVQW